VSYSSRSQVDELIEHARQTGRLEFITFAQKRDPCDTFYKKFKTFWTPVLPTTAETANVGVAFRETLPAERAKMREANGVPDDRQLLTLTTDAYQLKHFDADTLEPLGVSEQHVLHPSLTGPLSATHAAEDPNTGEYFNYNLAFGAKQVYRVFSAKPKTGKVEILAEISGSDIKGAYIHSLFVTENFVILCIWPAYFKGNGMSMIWTRNILDSIKPVDEKDEAVWLVIDRHHGKSVVKKFTSSSFFCFHTTNAWEENSGNGTNKVNIICELISFKGFEILHRFYLENLVSNGTGVESFRKKEDPAKTTPSLVRYKLADISLTGTSKTSNAKGSAELIMSIPSPAAGDLPRINPHYALKPNRYVWSVLNRGYSSFVDGLGKTDALTGTCTTWEYTHHTPGEPVFIPAPDAKEEDEGVVLSVVLNGNTGTSYLVCLDGKTMKEVGRAEVRRAVGMDFHGMHVPKST
jgi:torulene dioxygenase